MQGHCVCLMHSNICVAFNQGVILIPTCFITYLMGHIVNGCNFNDLQVGFECIKHKQENWFLRVIKNEVIHNLFYNKTNHSLIIVLVYAIFDNFSSLKCITTPIEYVSYSISFSFAFTTSSLDSLMFPSYS